MFTTPVAAQLAAFAAIEAGERLLDVGTGTGVVAITAARAGAVVTGLDLTPALLDAARHNAEVARVAVDWREGDAEDLPFEDASFDLVGCHNVIDHCERPDAVLREAVRVLKPGAPLVITLNTFSRVGRLKFECNRRLHPRDELFVEHPWSYTSESFEHLALGFGLVTRKAWGARVTWLGRSGLSGFVFSKPAKA